jgi:hypothetical protein
VVVVVAIVIVVFVVKQWYYGIVRKTFKIFLEMRDTFISSKVFVSFFFF